MMSVFDDAFFKRMSLTAWGVGICGTPLVYYFRQTQPWIAAVPVIIGLIIFVAIEQRFGTWEGVWRNVIADEDYLVSRRYTLGSQLREARSGVLLRFTGSATSTFGQLDLFEKKVAPIIEDQKGLFVITSEIGQEYAFITWHRFEELLLNEVMPDADRAADNALAKAFENVPLVVRRELIELLDKEIREIIKQDFRTSTVSLIAEATRRVALRLDAEAATAAHAKKTGDTKRRGKGKAS